MGYPNSVSRLGTRFGPYELQSLIGVGGMGATGTKLNRGFLKTRGNDGHHPA